MYDEIEPAADGSEDSVRLFGETDRFLRDATVLRLLTVGIRRLRPASASIGMMMVPRPYLER